MPDGDEAHWWSLCQSAGSERARWVAAATRARDEVPSDGTESDEKDDEVYVIYPTP